jgi:hypothetical protein
VSASEPAPGGHIVASHLPVRLQYRDTAEVDSSHFERHMMCAQSEVAAALLTVDLPVNKK